MGDTLDKLVKDKRVIEQVIAEKEGELTAETEALWESNTLSLAEKVDHYGYVLEHKENVEANTKEHIKIKQALLKRITSQSEYLKNKLYNSMAALKLEELSGSNYKFKPAVYYKSEVDQSKVESKYKTFSINGLKDEEVAYILDAIGDQNPVLYSKIKDNTKADEVGVSLLPNGHPAISKSYNPSVTMEKI
jgi:hypothetical protein